jgi:hypothetical protein
VLVTAPAAWADSAADVATSRTLAMEGLRLAQSGKCAEAIEKLARAEKLHHAPTTLEGLGACKIALGRVVDGTEDLRRVTLERLADRAPPAFRAAQAKARSALEQALPRIAEVRIDVVGPAPADASVTVDGAAVPAAAIGVERPFDPGAHTIEATATGYKSASTRVQIAEGGKQTVTLTLERQTESTPVPHEKHSVTTRSYVPAGVAFAIAGGSAIAGAIFGGVALANKNDLVSACGGTACSPAQKNAFDDVSTLATISTVTFVIAGVAAVAGIVLVALAPRHVDGSAEGGTSRWRRVETVSLRVAPTGFWLGGTF